MVVKVNTEGQRLSEFRKFKQFTQQEFAKQLGCSQPNLAKIESGQIGISSSLRAILFKKFPSLNPNWLDKGAGKMETIVPDTPLISDTNSIFNQDLSARFVSNLDRIELLLEEGKLSPESVSIVFKNLRKIISIQEEKIKDLEEEKVFLKSIIVTAKNSPFSRES